MTRVEHAVRRWLRWISTVACMRRNVRTRVAVWLMVVSGRETMVLMRWWWRLVVHETRPRSHA